MYIPIDAIQEKQQHSSHIEHLKSSDFNDAMLHQLKNNFNILYRNQSKYPYADVNKALNRIINVYYPDRCASLDSLYDSFDVGMPKKHIAAFSSIAITENTAIFNRPFGKNYQKLAEEGYASKGFYVKGKSSNWGPHAGFIPVNQHLCKHAGDQNFDIKKYQTQVYLTIENGTVQSEPLVLSKNRLQELIRKKVLVLSDPLSDKNQIRCSATSNHHHTEIFLLEKRQGNWHVFDASGEPFNILADPQHGPLIADYDLLMLAPKWEDIELNQADRRIITVPHVEALKRAKNYKDTSKEKISLNNPDVIQAENEKDDANLGNISARTIQIKNKLNTAMELCPGKEMVHHSDDAANPVTDMKANFPCTAFFPEALPGFGWAAVIKNEADLTEIFKVLMARGYAIYKNPLWEMNDIKPPFFIKAQEVLNNFLLQKNQHQD